MVEETVSIKSFADQLETAVANEETAETAAIVKTISDHQAAGPVVAELGKRLTAQGANSEKRTITAYALNAMNEVEAVHHLGKYLSDTRHDIDLRTTILGLLQKNFTHHPIETLTYVRQVLDKAEPQFRIRAQATFEFAITQTVAHETLSPRKILLDAGIKPSHLKPALLKKVENLDGAAIPVPSIFAEALGHLKDQESVDLLCQLLHIYQSEQLAEEQEALSGNGRSLDESPQKGQIRERIMLAAVAALRLTESEAAVNCLANALVKNLNYKVQRQAADALGKLGFQSTIPVLITALFTESNQSLKKKIGDALKENKEWQLKATHLVTHLSKNQVQRDHIEATAVIAAVQPDQAELAKNPHLLTDFLIDAAVQRFNDERLLQIFADLIKSSTNNNTTIINEQLEIYRENKNVSEEILQALRVEIGGAQTLRPLLNKLEKNLLDYFQKPIDSLNTDTQKIWKQTILLANLGFFVRILLNLAIFGVGAYFMIDSYTRIVAGSLEPQQVTALMAVFIGGGATMFGTFFTLPLKQIKRAVTDVGLANVAFISYIHCVLQISHTFSYFYLNGEITFDEIKNAARQIESTSHEAILTLNIAGSEGDQTQFDQALLTRIMANAKPQNNVATTPTESSTPPTPAPPANGRK